MKKFILMAVMAAATTSAFAQADVVKQAEKLFKSGDTDAALTTLEPALTNGTDAEKASAWNTLAEIQYQIFMNGQQQEVENQVKQTAVPYDTASMHAGIVESYKAALQCDVYDNMPNEKGKIKPKYRSTNQAKYQSLRGHLINAGLYKYNNNDREGAIEIWKLYIDSRDDALFTGLDMSQDPNRSEIAYYVGLTAYQMKDYETAVKYSMIAAEDTAKVKEANEILIFSQKENCKTREDTLAYLATVKELHAQYPEDDRYFSLISEIYAAPGHEAEMMAWCDEEIAMNPNNKMPYALKGEVFMNQGNWDEAIAEYKKALAIDPEFVQVSFNIGICLNSKALQLSDSLADATGRLTNDDANQIREIFAESKGYLEEVKSKDPNRELTNWPYPLYQVYYALGETEKAEEMQHLISGD